MDASDACGSGYTVHCVVCQTGDRYGGRASAVVARTLHFDCQYEQRTYVGGKQCGSIATTTAAASVSGGVTAGGTYGTGRGVVSQSALLFRESLHSYTPV